MPGREADTTRIVLLHFEGCPGFEKALGAVEEAVQTMRLPAEVGPAAPVPEEGSGALPGRPEFSGSPTILVDGEDLFPREDPCGAQRGGRAAAGTSCCRIYATPHGLQNRPTAAMVREALERRTAAN